MQTLESHWSATSCSNVKSVSEEIRQCRGKMTGLLKCTNINQCLDQEDTFQPAHTFKCIFYMYQLQNLASL